MNEIKRMSVAEFRRLGLLQEINRLFLHPRGLALEVVIDDDGIERFGEVWDYRDDPEGILFAEGLLADEGTHERARYVEQLYCDHLTERAHILGERDGIQRFEPGRSEP